MKTQIKKLLSILTLIAILATAFYTVPVSAAELTAEDFKVTLNGISEIFNEESTYVYLPFVKFQGDWVAIYYKRFAKDATESEIEQADEHLYGIAGYNGKEKIVTIPTEISGEKVKEIVGFNSANPIKTLKIHEGITEISSYKIDLYFDDSPENKFLAVIEEFEVAKENKYFASKDGVLYSKKLDEIIHYPRAKKDKTLVIHAKLKIDICELVSFEYNPYFEAIEVEKDHPTLSSKDGVLYDKKMTELLYYPKNKKDKSFVIPNTVTYIGNCLLHHTLGSNHGAGLNNHKYLENLTITENVLGTGECDFGPEIIPKKVFFKNTIINPYAHAPEEYDVEPFLGIRADIVYCYKDSYIHKYYQEYVPEQKIEFIEPETKTPANTSSKNETTKKPTASKVESNTSSEALLETESDVSTIIDTENTESEITTIGTNDNSESNTQENNPKNKSKVWIYIISGVVVLALSGGGFFVFKKFKK